MKRLWLVAAVGAVAVAHAALGGSTAYGGSTAASAAAPIKIGVLTSLTGNFAPWGIQARAGMALAVNEINRSGGVKGRGAGTDAQPRRRRRPVREHERGDRRLPAADAAGRRRRGRRHHRQQHRAGDRAARRRGARAVVPGKGGEQRDPDADQPLHVPHLPACGCHGGHSDRAARATARESRAWA